MLAYIHINKYQLNQQITENPECETEMLLKELFFENYNNSVNQITHSEMISSRIGIEHKNVLDISNHKLMLSKLF